MLRPLVEQLAELRFSRRSADEDLAGILLKAGQKLGHLQDSAAVLKRVVDKTDDLAGVVEALADVARALANLLQGFDAVEKRFGWFRGMM